MNRFLFMAIGEDPLASPKSSLLNVSRESIVLFGAIGLVVLALLGWAYLYYSNRRHGHRRHRHHRHHGHHHHRHDQPESERDGRDLAEASASGEESLRDDASESGEHSERRYRRRRHRRREHRPRNPTLAETGGLPPIRTDAPPGP